MSYPLLIAAAIVGMVPAWLIMTTSEANRSPVEEIDDRIVTHAEPWTPRAWLRLIALGVAITTITIDRSAIEVVSP